MRVGDSKRHTQRHRERQGQRRKDRERENGCRVAKMEKQGLRARGGERQEKER